MIHQFPSDHDNPTDSQVIVAITGTPAYIRSKLEDMLKQTDQYGKPIQGTEIGCGGDRTVVTPLWKGERY